jgi:hypothetical protein
MVGCTRPVRSPTLARGAPSFLRVKRVRPPGWARSSTAIDAPPMPETQPSHRRRAGPGLERRTHPQGWVHPSVADGAARDGDLDPSSRKDARHQRRALVQPAEGCAQPRGRVQPPAPEPEVQDGRARPSRKKGAVYRSCLPVLPLGGPRSRAADRPTRPGWTHPSQGIRDRHPSESCTPRWSLAIASVSSEHPPMSMAEGHDTQR